MNRVPCIVGVRALINDQFQQKQQTRNHQNHGIAQNLQALEFCSQFEPTQSNRHAGHEHRQIQINPGHGRQAERRAKCGQLVHSRGCSLT